MNIRYQPQFTKCDFPKLLTRSQFGLGWLATATELPFYLYRHRKESQQQKRRSPHTDL